MSEQVARVTIDHNEPILTGTVEEVDGHLLHGEGGVDGLEGFVGLARAEGLAGLAATDNLANVIFHGWPVKELSSVFV